MEPFSSGVLAQVKCRQKSRILTSCQAGPNAFPCGLWGRVLFCFTALFVPLGESQPRIGPAAPAGFLLTSAGPARTQPQPSFSSKLCSCCPTSILAPGQECARQAGMAGRGATAERKGKAASLLFLLQTLSHFNRWERQGSASSRLCLSAAWPQANVRESS